MSQGIVLLSVHKPAYAKAAYNMAFSLKFYNPELKIALIHDDCINYLFPEEKEIFDLLIPLSDDEKYNKGHIDIGKLKLSIYDKLPFNENIYLDVDGLALNDVRFIFDDLKKVNYATHVKQLLKKDSAFDKKDLWASPETIWKQYGLKDDAVLPNTNSSFQFIRKSDECRKLFALAGKHYDNPIPFQNMLNQWHVGGNPDELYMNIAMAELGIAGQTNKQYLLMGNKFDSRPMHELRLEYPVLCLLGHARYNRPVFTEYYDRSIHKMHMAKGVRSRYKYASISNDKSAPVFKSPVEKRKDTEIVSGVIPVSDTIQIDQTKLIQDYPSPTGLKVRVTNWLNCSFIRFGNKNYFCYRMESQPFCTVMKLGMCLLDDNLQPIQDTNVLLNLHSDVTVLRQRYAKGFHVEDPRLFVFNNELHLSYTDGYQMAQAKIDPETLQATESFYIDKIDPKRTEKNWVFFEYEKELLAIYDIPTMEIFKMNGPAHTPFSKLPNKLTWEYGEIRGGTSPIKKGDNYIMFFHSSTSINKKNKVGRQYHLGCIEFEGKAPFNIVSISESPLVSGERIDDSIARLSNYIYVVFPAGVIREESGYKVSFGYNDYRCHYVTISDELIKNTSKILIEKPTTNEPKRKTKPALHAQ